MAKATRGTESSENPVSTAVVVLNDKEKLQQQLRETIFQIDKRLSELEGTKKGGKEAVASIGTIYWENNGPLGTPNSNGAINIQNEVNVHNLISYYGRIRDAKVSYDTAAEDLGLKTYPVHSWNGHSSKNVLAALETRISIVANSNLISQLKSEKKKLEAFLSEEDRLASTLQSLGNLLKQ